jgi:tetratricopeptide (TPR) repeat protein
MMEISLADNIKNFSLPKVLAYLNRNRKTGTLIIKTPMFTKKAYLVKGDAIFASSTYEDDRLGEMLIKAGKITMEQYDASVEILKKTGKRQGAILIELGYLTPKDLFWGVKYQVKEIIYSLFQLEDAEYEFVEGEIPTQEVITLKMSMGNLIYEGVKRIDNWTRIKNELPNADFVLKLSNDPVTLFQDIELGQQDRKMLSIIDGVKTIKELISSSWIGSFEAMKILYVLWSIGVLEVKEIEKEKVIERPEEVEEMVSPEEILQPVPEDEEDFRRRVDEIYLNLDSLSENELLGVDGSSDGETIKKNYYRLAREFHPDRYFSSADPSIKDKLTSIFDAITRAYSMLKDESKRKKDVIPPGKVQEEVVSNAQKAEEQFKRGIEEFKKGNFWGAVDSLKWAIKLEPKRAKYWSYLSLSYTKIPNRLKDAEEALVEAIKFDPYNAEHYVNLGLIYIKAGMKKRAYNQFEKALKFDPENVKAKKGLDQTKG